MREPSMATISTESRGFPRPRGSLAHDISFIVERTRHFCTNSGPTGILTAICSNTIVGEMTVDEMLLLLASALNVTIPDEHERENILSFTGIVAHSSERMAAPLAAYMVGRSGLEVETAVHRVREALGTE